MEQIIMLMELLKGMNIPEDEMAEIASLIQENPMAAVAKIQKYMSPEMMQSMMQLMMTNPEAMSEAMEKAGIDEDQLEDLKGQLDL